MLQFGAYWRTSKCGNPSELIIGRIVDDCGFIMPHVKAFAAKIPSESHIVYLPGSYENSYYKLSPVWWLSNKYIFWEILLCISIRKGFVANKPKTDFDFLPVVTRLKPQMLEQVLWFRRPKTGVAGASSRAQKYLEIGLTFLQKYLCPDLRYSYNAADYKV